MTSNVDQRNKDIKIIFQRKHFQYPSKYNIRRVTRCTSRLQEPEVQSVYSKKYQEKPASNEKPPRKQHSNYSENVPKNVKNVNSKKTQNKSHARLVSDFTQTAVKSFKCKKCSTTDARKGFNFVELIDKSRIVKVPKNVLPPCKPVDRSNIVSEDDSSLKNRIKFKSLLRKLNE
ncbi:unnamed protein product [Phyllotreta striolata]|uniref:Uncharacterized protein n=1 Tax=Phyllotreta striolata TaxID=444603 RepID=A0A9N9XRD0_PHYSR|nr:unnamed protein product [Phyllotreta striolata]